VIKRRKLVPLSKSNPGVAREALNWDPKLVFPGSTRKNLWKCKKGHTYQMRVSHRVSGSGCPFCSGQKVLSGFNDLATKFPNIAKEAYGWDPATVMPGTHKKLSWKCPKGHIFTAQVSSRTSTDKTNCPFCSNLKILIGFNDLATSHPEIAKQAYKWDPKTVVAGTNKKLKWQCSKHHIYVANVSSRTGKNRSGCPVCSNLKLLIGFNDLVTTHPDIAAQAYKWDPKTVVAGTNKKYQWICEKNHKYFSLVSQRTSVGSGCAICANQKLLIGFNDLATTHPDIAAQAYKWDAKKFTAGSKHDKKWKCNEGHLWTTKISTRTYLNTNCPSCANFGFDPNKNAYLYLISHSNWKMLQIGITNVPDIRLSIHTRKGWEVLEIRGPMDGLLTHQWETAILRMLKANGADLSNSKIAGKFDGYSEAWSKSKFPAKSIKELMRLTEEFEEDRQ